MSPNAPGTTGGNGVLLRPIGVVRSPFADPVGMPIQPAGARGVRGAVEVFPEICEGLADLEGFSRIFLVYHFHRSEGFSLLVVPFLGDGEHGVFAIRAPRRPNPIGISTVRLVAVEGCRLEIEDVDILDGTPLLDIKPYVPVFDAFPGERTGWLARAPDAVRRARSDDRFNGRSGSP